ncbi:hypothetical protein LTR39_001733 [Cryomyces antarcticus]|nr:hypothetical protein LTR39_001733 [Cryomyces antarcticus]
MAPPPPPSYQQLPGLPRLLQDSSRTSTVSHPVSTSTMAPSTDPATLEAVYTSSASSQTFSHPLPSASSATSSVQEKTAYLSALRASAAQLQGEVNAFLTQKMDEDRAAEGKAKVDDEKEEENYGEEVVDEEG